ncbi:MAG: DUF4340 domain-containing protein [Eubacteriales bacterium]
MNQKKTLKILCIVCVVMIAAYLGVNNYLTTQEEAKLAEEEQLAEESIIHISEIEETVVGVTWNYIEEMEFEYVNDAWIYAPDEDVPLNESYVTSVVSTFSSLEALRELEGGDSLEDYGLETPQYTLELALESGETVTYYIGNLASEDYYVTIDDKSSIYTVSSTDITTLFYELSSMIYDDAFATVDSSEMYMVTVSQGDDEIAYTIDDEGVFDTVATTLSAYAFTGCVDYHADDNGELYGLTEEEQWTIEITYGVESEVTSTEEAEDGSTEEVAETVVTMMTVALNVGTADADGLNYYVNVDGSNLVYLVPVETINTILIM